MLCSKCPAQRIWSDSNKSKKSKKSTYRILSSTPLCSWCRQKFVGDSGAMTPEKAIVFAIEDLGRCCLKMKNLGFHKLINFVFATKTGRLAFIMDSFEVSQLHLKLIMDYILPGISHRMEDMPKYLKLSPLKYTQRRTTVTLNPNSEVANEFGTTTKKITIYQFRFEDLPGFEDWRERLKK